MPRALILSSYVAAERIGGGAQMLALAARGVEPFLVPTVVLGRNPAKGGRRQVVEPARFAELLGDAEAAGAFARVDVAVTGYFAAPEQVEAAAAALGRLKAASPEAIVVVDPILGDAPKGLYVPEAVAEAVVRQLLPLADWLAPNAWELGFLSGGVVEDAATALAAARPLSARVLASSIPAGPGRMGLLLHEPEGAALISHQAAPAAPNGTGDLVTAVLAAGLAQGLSGLGAATEAAQAAFDAVADAALWKASDLTVVFSADRPLRQAPVRVEPLEAP